MGGCVHVLSSMHNKQYKDFPVCSQKECCFQVFMSGFEIRDFGLFVKQSRLKHFQHGRKRVNITKYGVPSTCFMAVYN